MKRGSSLMAIAWFLNVLTLSAVVGTATPALSQLSVWSGGSGNWDPCPPDGNALWDTCPTFPDGPMASAAIQGGPVTITDGIIVNALTLFTGKSLIITPGYLGITGSSVVNNGTITVGPGNGLFLDGDVTPNQIVVLSGTGTVTMQSGSRFVGTPGTGATLVNQETIQGQGALGIGEIFIQNEGVINAVGGTLSTQPISMINAGTMAASSGATLQLANGVATPYDNTRGVIGALAGGTVQLDNGVYTGGELTTVKNGVIQLNNAAVLNSLTSKGNLLVSSGTLEGTITNTGKIQVPSAGILFISGGVSLTGAGSVLLSGSGTLTLLGGTDSLTNQQLIHGSGRIFQLPLTNMATIAGDSNGNTLTLAEGPITNKATLKASSGGTLTVETVVNNSAGTIQALDGSTVILFNSTVNGGKLVTCGTGTSQSQNGLLDGTVNVPSNLGLLEVSSADLFLQGTINNVGTIALSNKACVILNQASTLIGKGTLTMAPGTCIFGSGLAFTNRSTIVGAGSIGDSNPMPITNIGTIVANQASPLLIVPNASGFTNNGTLMVNAGSTLDIQGPFNNLSATGTLTAGTYTVAGALGLQNSIVTENANLTLNGAAAQVINTNTASNGLATLAAIAAKGVFSLQNGQALTTASKLSSAGQLTIDPTSSLKLGGSFTQNGGTSTIDGTLTAPLGLTVKTGSLMGKGTLAASVVSNSTITVGDSTTVPGQLTIAGTYVQNPTGVLNVEIGGTQVGTQYSQLAVSNGVSLGGTLNIKLLNGFVPTIGADVFTIVTGSAVSKTFTTVNGLSINSSEHFKINYNGNSVTLTVE